MDVTGQLHIAAGVGALILGGAATLRNPDRLRNRLFGLLCGAIALWTLGVAAHQYVYSIHRFWHFVYLLGACSAAPLGLHFALVVAGVPPSKRRRAMIMAYVLAGGLWLSIGTPAYRIYPGWNLAAMLVLGAILLSALGVVYRHVRGLREGPERAAYKLLLGGAVVGVIGGLSDFVPRGISGFPRLGPIALLVFLLIVCAIVVRHRFLDVDRFLARALALLVGAVVVSTFLWVTVRLTGEVFFPFFLATLTVLGTIGPVARALTEGQGFLTGRRGAVAGALMEVSNRLPLASRREEIWRVIDEGLRTFPAGVTVRIDLRDPETGSYRQVYGPADRRIISASEALPTYIGVDRSPVTRFYLADVVGEGSEARREPARRALDQIGDLGAELVIPLVRDEELTGWILVGGGSVGTYLNQDVAAAFLAVGNQTIASLERIEAMELARRRSTLAAVGEMAAGLAHEVRNPVAAIGGAAQVLLSDDDRQRAGEMLEVIREESERLGDVVGDFLEYARVGETRRQRVDVVMVIRDVLRSAQAADLALVTELKIEDDVPPVMGDSEQLRRAFFNIVRNAREATGSGGKLEITVARGTAGEVSVRFQDNGPGIEPDGMPGLFQPFHTTKPGGTGLGLALVHRVVEDHGGGIHVEGRHGLGAAFTLWLPAAEAR